MSSCVNICLLLTYCLCFHELYFNAAEILIQPLIFCFIVCYQTTQRLRELTRYLDQQVYDTV